MLLIAVMSVSNVRADDTDLDEDYPWHYHEAPMDFKFGNMIDSHQQSHLDANGVLHGFIYVHDTGDDTIDGYPIADKAHCPTGPCMVGWVIKGIKIEATLVNKSPRIWLINPAVLPKEPGYSHFHWLGTPHSPGGPNGLEVGETYEGYLMKRIAPAPFYWLGGPGSNAGGGGSGGGCGSHDVGGGDEGGCTDGEHEEGGCSGGGNDMGSMPDNEGGCTDSEHEEGGCSGGSDTGDNEGSGCSDGEHEEGGCAGGGHEGGSGGSQGRLVVEGVDAHINVVTTWDGTWHGGCHDD